MNVLFLNYQDTTGTPIYSKPGYRDPEDVLGVAGIYPHSIAPITFQRSMSWLWQENSWNLATDFAAGGSAVPNGVMFGPDGVANELEVIECGRLDYAVGSGGNDVNLHLFEINQGYVVSGDDHYPFVTISGQCLDGANKLYYDTNPSGTFGGLAPYTGSIIATVDSINISLYYGSTGSVTHGNMDFTINGTWPY